MIVPFLDHDMKVGHGIDRVRQAGQLVVMRGEERGCTALCERLGDGPGERQAVERAGASSDLIENHETVRSRVVQNVGGLGHFHHEGRPSAVKFITRSDAGHDSIHQSEPGRIRGDP